MRSRLVVGHWILAPVTEVRILSSQPGLVRFCIDWSWILIRFFLIRKSKLALWSRNRLLMLVLGCTIIYYREDVTILSMLPSKNIYRYHLVKSPFIDEFARDLFDGTDDAIKPENLLKNLDVLFNSIFENFESQEFCDAVKLLSK